jgi:DNA polymerase-4
LATHCIAALKVYPADVAKPNGLVVITKEDLPSILRGLDLQDIYGIGGVEQWLNRAGIVTVEQLWNATPLQLRRVWGGVNGLLFHQMLHGRRHPAADLALLKSKSIGHQHVLDPDIRAKKGARDYVQHLLTKAAERLRRGDYYCRRLGVHLSWVGDLVSAAGGTKPISTYARHRIPARPPRGTLAASSAIQTARVGVVLLDLLPADHHQPDLFAADNHRRQKLSPMIDLINERPLLHWIWSITE